MIMTARLRAIPVTDIRMMGPENDERASLLNVRREAIKNPVFKIDFCMNFKDIKYCCANTDERNNLPDRQRQLKAGPFYRKIKKLC